MQNTAAFSWHCVEWAISCKTTPAISARLSVAADLTGMPSAAIEAIAPAHSWHTEKYHKQIPTQTPPRGMPPEPKGSADGNTHRMQTASSQASDEASTLKTKTWIPELTLTQLPTITKCQTRSSTAPKSWPFPKTSAKKHCFGHMSARRKSFRASPKSPQGRSDDKAKRRQGQRRQESLRLYDYSRS